MLDIIKQFFANNQNEVEELIDEEDTFVLDVPRNTPTDTAYYYLNLTINGLNRSYHYLLMEELKNGTLVTHLEDATHEEMKDYCRMVWLPAHPAKFIFHAN